LLELWLVRLFAPPFVALFGPSCLHLRHPTLAQSEEGKATSPLFHPHLRSLHTTNHHHQRPSLFLLSILHRSESFYLKKSTSSSSLYPINKHLRRPLWLQGRPLEHGLVRGLPSSSSSFLVRRSPTHQIYLITVLILSWIDRRIGSWQGTDQVSR
jgi:hypothetical protein